MNHKSNTHVPFLPVTASGSNPISNDQIRELRADYFNDHTIFTNGSELSASSWLDVFDAALWSTDVQARAWLTPDEARQRCADAWNRLKGGE